MRLPLWAMPALIAACREGLGPTPAFMICPRTISEISLSLHPGVRKKRPDNRFAQLLGRDAAEHTVNRPDGACAWRQQ